MNLDGNGKQIYNSKTWCMAAEESPHMPPCLEWAITLHLHKGKGLPAGKKIIDVANETDASLSDVRIGTRLTRVNT